MKHWVLVGILAVAVTTGAARASVGPQAGTAQASTQVQGHTTPKPQEARAEAPAAPTGEMSLGTVRLGQAVKADGKVLPAGTYQVRLTAQEAAPAAKGQSPQLERWVEFLRGKDVKGREVATIVPKGEIGTVAKDPPPPAGGHKVEMLKGNDYVRVWINRGGNHFLIYLPPA